MIFQEYVDAPKVIEFAKELTHSVGTRGTVTEELTPPDTYQPGNIYVVLSGTENIDNGFQLVKCKSVSNSSLVCVTMEECGEDSDLEVYFKETSTVGKFAKQLVHSSLISVRIVNKVKKLYSIDKFEIEEIMFSINN